MLSTGVLQTALLRIPAILVAITFHECAHGYVAYLLGDHTAKASGRLSLNPLHHMDIIGTICMLLFGFGWAKPVPVNPQYFKNPKAGMSLVGLAGPVSNFLSALVFALIYALCLRLGLWTGGIIAQFFNSLLRVSLLLNIGLGVFNLIPFPPLDGSKILAIVLPDRWYYTLMRYERYAMPVLLVLLYVGVLDKPFQMLANVALQPIIYTMTWVSGEPVFRIIAWIAGL